MADETCPADLLYHPEHDWARIDGDTAMLGITWYAQDALGELVFFEPPEVGATLAGAAVRHGLPGAARSMTTAAASLLHQPVAEVVPGAPPATWRSPADAVSA